MPDLSQRYTGSELMDDLRVSGRDLHQALHELESINYLLGGNYVTLTGIAKLLENITKGDALIIADLGCGSGDMLKLIRRLLEKRKVEAVLVGIDANPNVIRFAADNTPPTSGIHFECLDIFSDEFRNKRFDIVTGTLFFHHFSDKQLISFFRQLRGQVNVGLIMNDIHRHWFAYYAIRWLTRIFSRSIMVKHDAPVSVLRAFRKQELQAIFHAAGIENFTVRWCWAFRWQVIVRF